MGVIFVFSGLVVTDRNKAAEWYARLFGRPADYLPNDIEAVWHTVEAASVFIVVDEKRAGHSSLALIVDDLVSRLAGIAERGIEVGPIVDIPGSSRMSDIFDPDGNKVSFVEVPER